ncbi:FAD-binding oxidoreductase [Candidatus Saccharibacteria bacterium]|nr:FAD-binding oxidoreductase [Candidatus Saccharibacteria bacterium]
MNKITTYLNQHIVGNVFEKASILEPYAFDRSVYKIMPRFVALPESTQDVRKLVRFVDQLAMKNFHLPIAVRGSGLDKTGADLTSGIVISTEKLNHIQEIDAHDRLVRVQAGVTLGQLNTALSLHGLTLPICADPRETIGSLIANCPVDDYSAKYGGITKFVNRVEFVLANGEIIQTAKLRKRALDKKKGLTNSEGVLYRNLGNLLMIMLMRSVLLPTIILITLAIQTSFAFIDRRIRLLIFYHYSMVRRGRSALSRK